jgi:hypothetical protein
MSSSRRQLAGKSPEEVAEFMAGVTQGSLNDQMAKAEFSLLQTNLQKEATEAAKETARYTQRYTRYMFWSVVILAASSLASFILALLQYLKK